MFSFIYASEKTTTATYSHRGMELCRAIYYVCVRRKSNGGSVLYVFYSNILFFNFTASRCVVMLTNVTKIIFKRNTVFVLAQQMCCDYQPQKIDLLLAVMHITKLVYNIVENL